MRKRKMFKLGILLIVIALSLGLYQFFREYSAINEEVNLRTAYYVKTGQVLNVVQKDFLEGSSVESSNTDVAEITNDGGIMAKSPGVATVTVTKPLEPVSTNPTPNPDSTSTPTEPQQTPQPEIPPASSEEEVDISNLPIEQQYQYSEEHNDENVPQEEYEVSYDFDVVVKQPVEGVKLNVEIAHLEEGQTLQLEPIFIPENAYNKTVSYQSLNNEVATISENGLVTAKKSGETAVEIVTQDGGFKSSCAIKVYAKKENNDLYVKEQSYELFTDEKIQVNATVTPNTDESSKIRYQSSDTNIFTVDSNGVITGKVHGQAELVVTYENIEKRIPVTVKEVVATSLQVSPKAVTLEKGESKTIVVDIEPKNTLDKSVNYSSSNSSVAEVVKGKILGKLEGTATIKVRTNNGLEETIEVTVIASTQNYNDEVKSIYFNEHDHTMYVGDTYRIKYDIDPKEASGVPINFESSNTAVAVVDHFGNVSAVGAGSAIITGGVGRAGDRMKVTVEEIPTPPTSITVSPTSINGLVGEVISLSTSILPVKNNNTSLTYKSSNDKVASVSKTGVVTLRKAGTATITVTTSNKLTATVNVVVTSPPTLTLNKTTINLIQEKSEKLTATVKNSSDKTIIWSSENPAIATVDNNGKVTAIAAGGTTTITATLKSNPSIKATVVVNVAAKKISATAVNVRIKSKSHDLLDHLIVNKDSTIILNISVEPANTTDIATVQLVSGQPKDVISLNQEGNKVTVKGLKTGTTRISIKAGKITKKIIVRVETPGERIYFTSKVEGDKAAGDTIIFRSSNEFGLVDTGRPRESTTRSVLSILNGLGVEELKFVIISHWDIDHYGNLKTLLDTYKINKVYAKTYSYNGNPVYSYEFYEPNKLKNIESTLQKVNEKSRLATPENFKFNDFEFTAYNTEDTFKNHYNECKTQKYKGKKIYCLENINSLVYLVKIHNKKVLLTGDIQESMFNKKSIPNMYKQIGKVDIYKISHHGYPNNNKPEWIKLLKPKYAIATNLSIMKNSSMDAIRNYTGSQNMYATQARVIVSHISTQGNINIWTYPAKL